MGRRDQAHAPAAEGLHHSRRAGRSLLEDLCAPANENEFNRVIRDPSGTGKPAVPPARPAPAGRGRRDTFPSRVRTSCTPETTAATAALACVWLGTATLVATTARTSATTAPNSSRRRRSSPTSRSVNPHVQLFFDVTDDKGKVPALERRAAAQPRDADPRRLDPQAFGEALQVRHDGMVTAAPARAGGDTALVLKDQSEAGEDSARVSDLCRRARQPRRRAEAVPFEAPPMTSTGRPVGARYQCPRSSRRLRCLGSAAARMPRGVRRPGGRGARRRRTPARRQDDHGGRGTARPLLERRRQHLCVARTRRRSGYSIPEDEKTIDLEHGRMRVRQRNHNNFVFAGLAGLSGRAEPRCRVPRRRRRLQYRAKWRPRSRQRPGRACPPPRHVEQSRGARARRA